MLVAAFIVSLIASLATVAQADVLDVFDCTGPTTNPQPGSVEWELRDQNNRYCAMESAFDAATNPAFLVVGAEVQSSGVYTNDAFREPKTRWNEIRGRYREVTFTTSAGDVMPGSIYMPLADCSGERCAEPPYPGVVVVCHMCSLSADGSPHGLGNAWAAEALAEAGYMVFVPNVGGNNVDVAIDALDFFFATENVPSVHGEFNPEWELFDHEPIGITGWSGAAGVSLAAGLQDDRVGAIVSWDHAGPGFADLTINKPLMFQTADYLSSTPAPGFTIYEPRRTQPEPYPRHGDFDVAKAAGVDTMLLALRGTSHFEWGGWPTIPHSRHGERIATYYTLAWFDRYVMGANDSVMAQDALERLLATTFDDSADVYSIGTGVFDPYKASRAGNLEAGNAPIMIEGLSVQNMLSFWFPSRYFFDAGAIQCDDMKAGCS